MTTTIRNKKIIELSNKGIYYARIGEIFGISRQRVHQIVTGYSSGCLKVNPKYKDYIFKRDKNRCVLCRYKKNLIIHHINKNRTDNDYRNLILLCRSCHTKIHNKEQFDFEFNEYQKYVKVITNKKATLCGSPYTN